MKTYNELFAQNAELPAEATLELRTGFIKAFRENLVGRQMMPTLPLPASAQSYAYDRIATEPGPARVIAKGALFPMDEYDAARLTVQIPKIGWGFKIPREDFLAGVVQNQSTDFARRRMQEKEDNMIFDGDADYNILGLLDYAGNTRAAVADWNTAATIIQIYDDVRLLIGQFEADKVQGPYTIVVHPEQASGLRKLETTNFARTARDLIGELVDEVLVSYAIPDSTVLMMRRGSEIARLGVAEDLTVETPLYDADRQEYRGRAFERLIPIVYQYGATANKSDAIGTITAA